MKQVVVCGLYCFKNLLVLWQYFPSLCYYLQTHANARGPHSVPHHDPTNIIQLQFQWATRTCPTGHKQYTAWSYSPYGHLLSDTHLPWRGSPFIVLKCVVGDHINGNGIGMNRECGMYGGEEKCPLTFGCKTWRKQTAWKTYKACPKSKDISRVGR